MAKRTAGGRPTTYRPLHAEQARKLAQRGATTQEIADILNVSVPTIYVWRNRYPEFLESLKLGNYAHANSRVERSFYERCIGYTIKEAETIEKTKGKTITTVTYKHVPADVRGQMWWLTKRDPDQWAPDPQKLHLSIEDNRTPDEMRIALIDRLAAMLGAGSPLIEGTISPVETPTEEDRDE